MEIKDGLVAVVLGTILVGVAIPLYKESQSAKRVAAIQAMAQTIGAMVAHTQVQYRLDGHGVTSSHNQVGWQGESVLVAAGDGRPLAHPQGVGQVTSKVDGVVTVDFSPGKVRFDVAPGETAACFLGYDETTGQTVSVTEGC